MEFAAPLLSAGLQLIGGIQSASASRAAAERQATQDRFQRDQMTQNAGQDIAAAQRKAHNEKVRANMLASRAVAAAGASGGGLTDPSIINLIADIQGEGAYRSNVQLYQGEEQARGSLMGADAKNYEAESAIIGGRQKSNAYLMKGFTGAGSTLYSRFGGGGPRAKKTGDDTADF